MGGGFFGPALVGVMIVAALFEAMLSVVNWGLHVRQSHLLGDGLGTARAYIVTSVGNKVTSGCSGPCDPASSFPPSINNTFNACPTANGLLCTDTITVTATTVAMGTSGASTTSSPNVNVGTSPTNGYHVTAQQTYYLNESLATPGGAVLATRTGYFTVCALDTTTSSNAAMDCGFREAGGVSSTASRLPTSGTCATTDATCNSTMLVTATAPTPADDTRIHSETTCTPSPTGNGSCTPTGNPTAPPQTTDNFSNQNVPNSQAGWIH